VVLVRREIEVIKILQHPNIIRFYDVFEDLNNIYVVMEILSGGDLFTYLQKNKFFVSQERAKSLIN
jgi:serine/threonine protein kinase